jgi:hypothetical protein
MKLSGLKAQDDESERCLLCLDCPPLDGDDQAPNSQLSLYMLRSQHPLEFLREFHVETRLQLSSFANNCHHLPTSEV